MALRSIMNAVQGRKEEAMVKFGDQHDKTRSCDSELLMELPDSDCLCSPSTSLSSSSSLPYQPSPRVDIRVLLPAYQKNMVLHPKG